MKSLMIFGSLCLSLFSFASEEPEKRNELKAEASSTEGATKCKKCCKRKPNGADFKKHKKALARIYARKAFSADTLWCHHLDEKGRHIVLNGLRRKDANECCGVFYSKLVRLECGKMRKDGAHHNACTAAKCPYIRDGVPCPYTEHLKSLNKNCDGE